MAKVVTSPNLKDTFKQCQTISGMRHASFVHDEMLKLEESIVIASYCFGNKRSHGRRCAPLAYSWIPR